MTGREDDDAGRERCGSSRHVLVVPTCWIVRWDVESVGWVLGDITTEKRLAGHKTVITGTDWSGELIGIELVAGRECVSGRGCSGGASSCNRGKDGS